MEGEVAHMEALFPKRLGREEPNILQKLWPYTGLNLMAHL